MPFVTSRAAVGLCFALLAAGKAGAIEPPGVVPQLVGAACAPLEATLAPVGYSCVYLSHLASSPCDAPVDGAGAACDALAQPCHFVHALDAGTGDACASTGLVPPHPARACADATCARVATGDGGASATWSATSVACFATEVCYETRFHAEARARLPGVWTLRHARELRQDPGNELVTGTRAEDSCSWRDEGACARDANGPALRLGPTSGDVRAYASFELWWRDSLGQEHLQAMGASCAYLPGPGRSGSC